MKKTLCMLLITAMLLSVMPIAVFAADATPAGTPISTAEELHSLADNGTYYLANDITITPENALYTYDPIDGGQTVNGQGWRYRSPLVGTTLDGNGKTIYYADGLTIWSGLFSEVNGITIKNLNVVQLGNVTYKGLGGEVSPLVRRVVGGTVTITDVNVYANINMKSEDEANQAGGIVAQITGSSVLKLTRCVFSGSITKNHSDGSGKGVSGMLGGSWCMATGQQVYMYECINYADISSKNSAGGFFGSYRSDKPSESSYGFRKFEIVNCINYGDITVNASSGSQNAGGFLGYFNIHPDSSNYQNNTQVLFKYNINYGDVTASGNDSRAGGFVGGLSMQGSSGYKLYGFVNYGELSATADVDNAVGRLIFNGGDTKRDANTNYTHSTSYVKHNGSNVGSGADLITDVAAACNTLNARMNAGGGYYVLLANGKLGLVWANNAGYDEQVPTYIDATLVGVQLSGESGDLKRNVRFVCGVNGISNLSKLGVKIIAKDANGNQLKVFEGDTDTVYESIMAGGKDVYAEEYGKTYFYTAVIEGVPTDLGEISFEVCTFQQMSSGVVTYNRAKKLPVDMGDLPLDYVRNGWTLLIPAYDGGTLAESTYDAGTGIDKDTGGTDINRAYMMCVSGTTKSEFEAYCEKLEKYGFVLGGENTLKGAEGENNLYCEYRRDNKLVYVYFNSSTSEARIIEDHTSVAEAEFEYSSAHDATTQTDIYLYGMKYTQDEEGTPDNGAFYIIKQADNSVILIDGGGGQQSTEAAQAELWRFLKDITGVGDSGTVKVACWFITHPHEDHYRLAYDVLVKNRSRIDLQRVMFNFPNPNVTGQGIIDFRGEFRNYYPNVKLLKCHTGQSIKLGSIDIDILLTHEDLVDAKTGKSKMLEVAEGNLMTTVARFTLPNGTVFLNLGDLEEEAEEVWLGNMLDESELKCDIVTVAHHGYNEVEDTYKAAKATYVLWPNHTSEKYDQGGIFGIGAHWKYTHAQNIIKWVKNAGASESNIYYAGKNTVKLTCVNDTVTVTTSTPVY